MDRNILIGVESYLASVIFDTPSSANGVQYLRIRCSAEASDLGLKIAHPLLGFELAIERLPQRGFIPHRRTRACQRPLSFRIVAI